MYRTWTQEEERIMNECYRNTPLEEMGLLLTGRSLMAIQKKAGSMGLSDSCDHETARLAEEIRRRIHIKHQSRAQRGLW